MSHRHRRSRSRWPWRRHAVAARASSVSRNTSNVPPVESSEDRYVARLIGAVDVGLGVVASAYGSRGVVATHRRTGRYVMVVVDFHPGWGRLAWHWLSGGEIDVIAPVGEVETVVGAIHRALSGPRAEAGRPGIRRDLP